MNILQLTYKLCGQSYWLSLMGSRIAYPLYKNNTELNDAINKYASDWQLNSKSLRKMRQDIFMARCYYKCIYKEYFWYRMYEKNKKERKNVVGWLELRELIKSVQTDSHIIFDDKWQTFRRFKKYYRREVIHIESPNDKQCLLNFISKKGKSIVKISNLLGGNGVFLCENKEQVDNVFQKILPYLKEGKAAVAEQYVKQSDEIGRLNPTSVNTIRIATFLDANNVIKMFSFLRTGRSGSIVDNGAAGGIFISVNLQSGICETDGASENMEVFEAHPDTKIRFKGFQIPKWQEALALADELARVVPDQRYASWDLALTDNGWVMIEGNSRGGFIGPQITTQKGIRDIAEKTFYKHI